jgi:hypothetical protein
LCRPSVVHSSEFVVRGFSIGLGDLGNYRPIVGNCRPFGLREDFSIVVYYRYTIINRGKDGIRYYGANCNWSSKSMDWRAFIASGKLEVRSEK